MAGRPACSSQLYLDSNRATNGERHQNTLIALNNMGQLMRAKGELAAAEELLAGALRTSREVLGEWHYGTINCVANLADVLRIQGRVDDARALLGDDFLARATQLHGASSEKTFKLRGVAAQVLLADPASAAEGKARLAGVVAEMAGATGEGNVNLRAFRAALAAHDG